MIFNFRYVNFRLMKALWYVLFLISLISCNSGKASAQSKLPVRTIILLGQDGKEIPVQVEVADTDQSRVMGLMNRKSVPEGTGMLFVFDRDQVLTFWMKNTLVPLSIAYISSDGRIVDILDMEPESLKPVASSRSVRYALEVPQGYFSKVGIREGDRLIGLPD